MSQGFDPAVSWWLHNTAAGARTLARMVPRSAIPPETRRLLPTERTFFLADRRGRRATREERTLRALAAMIPRLGRDYRDATPYAIEDGATLELTRAERAEWERLRPPDRKERP